MLISGRMPVDSTRSEFEPINIAIGQHIVITLACSGSASTILDKGSL